MQWINFYYFKFLVLKTMLRKQICFEIFQLQIQLEDIEKHIDVLGDQKSNF